VETALELPLIKREQQEPPILAVAVVQEQTE
jgi:hypothetical protein